ncbi:MAG: efflux RND transporter permease subunit [Acidiferrobacterales bacterium]
MTSRIMSSHGTAAWLERHPVTAAALLLAIALAGLFAFFHLRVGLPPHLGDPQLRIVVHDPGVPAAIMDARVASPLLHFLKTLPGPTGMRAASSEGETKFVLYFDSKSDRDQALPQARSLLARSAAMLPESAEAPIVTRNTPIGASAVELLVTAPQRSLSDLRHWTDDGLLPQFLGLRGVANLRVDGGPVREIQVVPDQRRLAGLGLALDDVVTAVRNGEAQSSGGHLAAAAHAASAAIGALPVRLASGDTLSLSEVARVHESNDNAGPIIRFDGIPAVRLVLTRASGTSPVRIADEIKARLDWLHANGQVPKDVNVSVLALQARTLGRTLRRFYLMAAGGLALAFGVLLALGGKARASLVQILTVLAALLASGATFAAAGMSLNMMSLAGLVVAIGPGLAAQLAVQESLKPGSARAIAGRNPWVQSAPGGVLPLLLVLSLLLVIPGPIGRLCRDLIVAVVAVTLLSWISGLILVRGWLRRPTGRTTQPGSMWYRGRKALITYYRRWLSAAIRLPLYSAVAAFLVLSGAAVYAGYFAHRAGFLPLAAGGEIVVGIEFGNSIPVRVLNDIVPVVERLAREQGGVVSILSVQSAPPFAGAKLRIELASQLQNPAAAQQWINQFERAVTQAHLRDVRVRAASTPFPGVPPDRADDPLLLASDGEIGIRVTGPDRGILARIAHRVAGILRNQPSLRDVHYAADAITRDFVLHLDPALAAERGVDEAQAARAVRIARGGLVVGSILDGDHRLDIRVALTGDQGDAAQLPKLLLRGETRKHVVVHLGDVATVESVREADELNRGRQQPVITVNSQVASDRSGGAMVDEIEQSIRKLPLPSGYRLSFTGFAAGIDRDAAELVSFTVLGLPLFALGLTLRYRGWRRPLIVLLGASVALIGAMVTSGMAGRGLSLPGWFGVILAFGVGAGMTMFALDLIDSRLPRRGHRNTRVAMAAADSVSAILRFGFGSITGAVFLATIGVPEFALLRPLTLRFAGGVLAAIAASLLWVPVLYGSLLMDHAAPGTAKRALHHRDRRARIRE